MLQQTDEQELKALKERTTAAVFAWTNAEYRVWRAEQAVLNNMHEELAARIELRIHETIMYLCSVLVLGLLWFLFRH